MHLPAATFFRLFRSRQFRLAMLAFQLLWLNVIVPGHRRGIVAIPGDHCTACDDANNGPQAACPADQKSSHHAPVDSAAHCAICFFAARLSPAVAYDFTHPPLRLIAIVDSPAELASVSPQTIRSYDGRAPPIPA